MENLIENKSFCFSVRVVKLCRYLRETKKECTLSKQLLRSGTSIGANVAEAQQAQSKADFIAKMSIALKEAAETDYWLRLLYTTGYLSKSEFSSIYADSEELSRLLVSIVKSAKKSFKICP